MVKTRLAKLGFAAGSTALGAAVALLLDPHSGARRRHQLVDRGAATLRRGRRRVGAKARYQRGRLLGLVHTRRHQVEAPTDDIVLKQHVHEALHRAGLRTAALSVEVSEGVATLRGEVPTPSQRQLVQDITANVPGVLNTVTYVHLPGEPAPNKLAALHAAR